MTVIKKAKEMTKMKDIKNTSIREHLTVLLRRRSVIALCCVILTMTLAFYGVIEGVNRMNNVMHENGFMSFTYFTMVSNVFAALSAAFVFPFAVEGIRKKRFILPKWAALIHFTATVSIAVTMVFVFAFVSRTSPYDAFGGSNFVTHVICPLLIIVSFFQIESGHLFTWKDRLFGIILCVSYMLVYYVEVSLIGEANGGWPDIYRVLEYISPAVAIPSFILLSFGVSVAVSFLSNRLTKKRNKKTFMLWKDDLDPVEVKIEAFGMGRMAAQYGEDSNLQIPYDILTSLAKRYDADPGDLMRAFVKGLITERRDIENKKMTLTNRDRRR